MKWFSFNGEKVRKNGEIFAAGSIFCLTNHDHSGQLTGFIEIVEDLTERKLAQKAQESLNRHLEAKVNELEVFSYGIAHDMRGRIVSIGGISHLLREDLLSPDQEGLIQNRSLINSSVRKLTNFLDSILE